jgi:hypothetical protein
MPAVPQIIWMPGGVRTEIHLGGASERRVSGRRDRRQRRARGRDAARLAVRRLSEADPPFPTS